MRYINRAATFRPRPGSLALGNEPKGVGIDWCAMDMIVSDPDFPANNYLGDPAAIATYSSPSTKWVTNRHGILVAGTTLRTDHDPGTLDSSTTQHLSAPGPKNMVVSGAASYAVGQVVVASNAANIEQWMIGRVTAWNAGTKIITLDVYANSGRFVCSSWKTIVALGLCIESQRANLLLHSNDLTNAAWTKNAVTVSPSFVATGPDGVLSLRKWTPNAVSQNFNLAQNVTLAAGTRYTYSQIVKAAEFDTCSLLILQSSATVCFCEFNLTTREMTPSPATPPEIATIDYLGNGLLRISITFTSPAAASTAIRFYDRRPGNRAGDGVSGIFVGYGQIEASLFPSTYIATTTAQVTRATDVIVVPRNAIPNGPDMTLIHEGSTKAGTGYTTNTTYTPSLRRASDGRGIAIYSNPNRFFSQLVTSGASAGPLMGAVVVGEVRKVGFSVRNGMQSAVLNGGPVFNSTVLADMDAWDQYAISGNVSSANAQGGHVRSSGLFPRYFSDAELQMRTAA